MFHHLLKDSLRLSPPVGRRTKRSLQVSESGVQDGIRYLLNKITVKPT